MAEDLSKSLIIRSIKKGGGLLAEVGPWLPIPYLGAIGKVIEKLPIEEGVEWAKKAMARFGKAEPAGRPLPAVGPAAPINEVARPIVIALEHRPEVIERVAHAVRSEPFEIALSQAVADFPAKLGDFMLQTCTIAPRTGIWPTFVLEEVARWHFRTQLGESVAAEDPAVASLIENGLGREAVELLRLGVESKSDDNPPGAVLPGIGIDFMRVWKQDPDFAWPELGELSPGFFTARKDIEGDVFWKAKDAELERAKVLGRLGRMGRDQLAEVVEAWQETCDALLTDDGIPLDEVNTDLPELKPRRRLALD